MDVVSLEIVFDTKGKWHFLMHDDDELGLTLCGDGNGWDMAPTTRFDEIELLELEKGCMDCLIGAGSLGTIRKDNLSRRSK